MEKKISEMNSKELFGVLTGNHGPLAQMYLREVIMEYRRIHGRDNASLEDMVKAYELPKSA